MRRLALLVALGILALPAAVAATTVTPSPTVPVTPTSTPCGPFDPPELEFSLAASPSRPVVGEDVALAFSIRGGGGLPRYTISGASDLFEGDTGPREESSITGTVVYNLRAVRSGVANVSMCVNFEYVSGCSDFSLPIFAFTTMCSQSFTVEVSGGVVTPTPSGASATPTACETYAAPTVDFAFSIDPPAPVVGDDATLTVSANTVASGLPEYTLSGASEFFDGDVAPRAGTSSVTYDLRAAHAGIAHLRMCVFFEIRTGCILTPVFQYTTVCSNQFDVEIAEAAPTPTPTATPCETFPPPHLEFGFTADPAQPRTGDRITLTVSIQGSGGIPQYRLSGTEDVFAGDVGPRSSTYISSVQYDLRAVAPGSAGISMCVNFEFPSGCVKDLPIFQFTTNCSSTFDLEVARPLCVGDCNDDAAITVDDLSAGIAIATGEATVETCPGFDTSGDGSVTVDELVAALSGALFGCERTP